MRAGSPYGNDGGLGDFVVGQATGARYNTWSNLGADLRQPLNAPASSPLPRAKNNRSSSNLVGEPSRPLTAEQITAINLKRSRLHAYTRRAPLLKRLRGYVRTWLDADGIMMRDENGDLRETEVVPKQVHLQRLEKAYGRFWEEQKNQFEGKQEPNALIWYTEAVERLALLERGKYISPLSRDGTKLYPDTFERRKGFFQSKLVRKKFKPVSLSEYDRRFRKFVVGVYGIRNYGWPHLYDRHLGAWDARTIFSVYVGWPQRQPTWV